MSHSRTDGASSPFFAWTRSYEPHRNLISAVENTFGETVISRFDYANDEIGRRTAISRSGTAFDTPVRDAYGYNARSEVTSARRALADNPNQGVRGFSYDYAYDPIGNRITSKEYDHEDNARVSSYTANELNQYTQRTVPGYAGVRGSATNTATVTVNGTSAWRLGEYFYGGDDAANAASAVIKELDITAVVNPSGTNEADLVQSVTGKVFVAKSPEAFTYDDDGNLLSDGRFAYTWDGENRLASIETSATAASAGVPHVKVVYTYDCFSRRFGKEVSHYCDDIWTLAESRSFLYDGWNMIREYQYSNIPSFHSSTNSYVWGLDLSGSLQGAGGVGGLLEVSVTGGDDSGFYHPTFDANGNVMEYISTDGTIAAHYEYSPFGETVIQSGAMANAFAFRYSTKYWENETRLYYYGYRFYVPAVGRWLSRDLAGEGESKGLYSFLNNNALSQYDLFGLMGGVRRCCAGKPYDIKKYCCLTKIRNLREEALMAALLDSSPGVQIDPSIPDEDFTEEYLVDRTSVATGVIVYNWKGPGTLVHYWITWPGADGTDSADVNCGSVLGLTEERIVRSPARGNMSSGVPTEIKLSPCEYDINGFKQCINDEVKKLTDQPFSGGLCAEFIRYLVEDTCKVRNKVNEKK